MDALPALTEPRRPIDVFSRLGVLSERELTARADINWERYVKVSDIEASCALDMARTMILPAGVRYLGELAGGGHLQGRQRPSPRRWRPAVDALVAAIDELEHAQHAAHEADSVQAEARAFRDKVIPAQEALRAAADELETLVADDLWPLPKYRELLFQY